VKCAEQVLAEWNYQQEHQQLGKGFAAGDWEKYQEKNSLTHGIDCP
jgi:predicted secreted acid phosphatase